MKSPQAMLRLLRDRRQDAAEKLDGSGEFGVAVCEVLDELIRRAQVVADEYPVSSKITLRDLQEMPAVVGSNSSGSARSRWGRATKVSRSPAG